MSIIYNSGIFCMTNSFLISTKNQNYLMQILLNSVKSIYVQHNIMNIILHCEAQGLKLKMLSKNNF